MTDEQHDVVVVGGGPAGVSCALECFDIKLDVLLLEGGDALGGQLPEIPHAVRNVAVGRFASGPAVQGAMEDAATILGDRARLGHAVSAVDVTAPAVEAAGTRFPARALVIATGAARRELPAAPDGAFGGDVSYLIESRPGWFAGRDVVVVGGGDSATLDALELAEAGSSVFLVHRSDRLTARADVVDRLRREPRITELPGWEVEEVHGGERVDGVTVVRPSTGERRQLAVGGVVVKVGRAPRTGIVRGHLDLDGNGAVVVDAELRTSRRGVFAAGDVVAGSYWRVATALGHGSLAARSVLRHLRERP